MQRAWPALKAGCSCLTHPGDPGPSCRGHQTNLVPADGTAGLWACGNTPSMCQGEMVGSCSAGQAQSRLDFPLDAWWPGAGTSTRQVFPWHSPEGWNLLPCTGRTGVRTLGCTVSGCQAGPQDAWCQVQSRCWGSMGRSKN